MSPRGPKTVEATANSFEILETLVAATDPLGVTELADSVGLSKGVVYNHLGTLSELGYVQKSDGKYRPSLQLLSLGARTRNRDEMYRAARNHVDNLAQTTGEVTTLFIEEDGLGICAYMAADPDSWSPDYICGGRVPLHVTAAGKAILATLPAERVDEIVAEHGLSAATDQSITDKQTLHTELQTVQDNGVAFSREEQFDGIVGVATSFGLDERGPAAAIGVCGPQDRLSGRYLKEDITGQVISTAKSIQVDLTK
ncbi:IclR family transcriptional regulator [Haloarcula laminariae]|uniref:IclR family transcriptional regulator n=1 Tax=Haloarcula laminariae TaxID=2961577 RepID=UPI0021C6298C|nr:MULTISPECIES: IclR family transcriptional regulator [Halomicroarcula]